MLSWNLGFNPTVNLKKLFLKYGVKTVNWDPDVLEIHVSTETNIFFLWKNKLGLPHVSGNTK